MKRRSEGIAVDSRRPPAGNAETEASGEDDEAFCAAARADRARLLLATGVEARTAWRPGRGLRLAGGLAHETEGLTLACASLAGALPKRSRLIALGGLARGELAPHSDLDLLVAFDAKPEKDARDWASHLMRLLWDCGLRAALGVRTLRECARDAADDLDFLTSLSTGKVLTGDHAGWEVFVAGILRREGARALPLLLSDSAELEDSLYLRPGRVSSRSDPGLEVYAREPDLKNGYGGLRSAQRMEWLGVCAALPQGREAWRGIVGRRGARRVDTARDLLLHLRIRLHDRRGREIDTLRHEDLEIIARESGLRPSELASLVTAARRRLAAAELQVRRSIAGHDARGASSRKLRSATAALDNPHLGPRAPGTLREILSANPAADRIAALDAEGRLADLLPAWGEIRDRWPEVSFHDLPIGAHSIRAIHFADLLLGPDREAARQLSEPISHIADRYLETAWILRLALLLHDLGKAWPGDHAKNGATLAEDILAAMPIEPLIKDMIVLLVERHLLLANVSRRAEVAHGAIEDDLATEFTFDAYPEDSFGLLALLTVCDIAATNPKAWSGFRRSRLEKLLTAVDLRLSNAAGPASRRQLIQGKLHELDSIPCEGASFGPREFAERLGRRYLLATGIEAIVHDFELWSRNGHDRVDLDVSPSNDHLRVKIFAPDEPGLFASLAGILLAAGADIVHAQIAGLDGIAIDEFLVTEIHGNDLLAGAMALELSLWTAQLGESLRHYLANPKELSIRVRSLESSVRPAPTIFRSAPMIDCRREEGGYRVELSCTDRPALLFDLAVAISAQGYDIAAANIETRGFRVHDSFHLRSPEPRSDADLMALAAILADVGDGGQAGDAGDCRTRP